MFEVEDITESMNEQGDEGQWRSVIYNMDAYRVKMVWPEEFIYEVYTQDMQLVEDEDIQSLIINGAFYV